jgi:hypothetical protein
VDSGELQVAYIEHGPGMFDGVQVKLGPLAGDYYPVISGLKAGQRVAHAGVFLIDAETRLNPHLAAAYFGAAGAPSASAGATPAASGASEAAGASGLAALDAADRALAMRQRICPVTRLPLGSMGAPVKVKINGKVEFLCCEGCRAKHKRLRARGAADD